MWTVSNWRWYQRYIKPLTSMIDDLITYLKNNGQRKLYPVCNRIIIYLFPLSFIWYIFNSLYDAKIKTHRKYVGLCVLKSLKNNHKKEQNFVFVKFATREYLIHGTLKQWIITMYWQYDSKTYIGSRMCMHIERYSIPGTHSTVGSYTIISGFFACHENGENVVYF